MAEGVVDVQQSQAGLGLQSMLVVYGENKQQSIAF